MSWRTIIVSGVAKLDYKLDYLVVRKTEKSSKIHISEIGLLMIQSTTISLTTALLSALVKNKVKVIFCDQEHNPQFEAVPYYGAHNCSLQLKRQINWTDNRKQEVWTAIVADKICKQAELLDDVGHRKQAKQIRSFRDDMLLGDRSNREGHAAKVYFHALFGPDFHRGEENSVNAALNYGYAIVLSCFNREIVAQGYETRLGIFHDSIYNYFNLSSDLMEPYRVLVDRVVFHMNPTQFGHEEKMALVKVLDQTVMVDGKRQRVNYAIRLFTNSVLEVLEGEDLEKIKFYKNEL